MFYRKIRKSVDVFSCVKGITRQLRDVRDSVFALGSMGKGSVIYPLDNTIYSPVEGVAEVVFPTGHFIGITTEDNFEIIIHIGVDTAKLNGEGFEILVEKEQKVEVGTPLVKCDFDLIKEKGYFPDVIVLLHGPRKTSEIVEEIEPGVLVEKGDLLFKAMMIK